MIMDSNYFWTQREHNGPAQKIWSKVFNDTLREQLFKQNQVNFRKDQPDIPIFSTISQSKEYSWHNPPVRINYDFCNGKEKSSEESYIEPILQIVKRKRDYNKASTYGYELQIELGMISTLSGNIYPWNLNKKIYKKNLSGLHEEVFDFYRYIMPTEEEKLMRHEVIERLKQVIHNEWVNAKVDVFGSFKTELYLPTSDIDVVIFVDLDDPLWTLHDIIKASGISSDCKVLDKATVPIVKMTDKESDIRIDISFNMQNGIKSAELIKSFIGQYPQLPQLVLIIKQYLLQLDLKEVWTGGISSYSLTLMCVGFMKNCEKLKMEMSDNIGITLIRFLEMYGRNFDYSIMGIRIGSDCPYVCKDEIMKNMDTSLWPSILCIEDPLNPANDIGRSSYGALHVKLAFEYAYDNLVSMVLPHLSYLYKDQQSLLGRIIRITPEVMKYRAFIKTKYSKPHFLETNHKTGQSHQPLSESNFNNDSHKATRDVTKGGEAQKPKPENSTLKYSSHTKATHSSSRIYKNSSVENNEVRYHERTSCGNKFTHNSHKNRYNHRAVAATNNRAMDEGHCTQRESDRVVNCGSNSRG